MRRMRWAIGPAIALVVAVGIAWATKPSLLPITALWLSDWDGVTVQRAYARYRAALDSADTYREAWVLADSRERAAREPAAPPGLTIRADADVPTSIRDSLEPRIQAEFDALTEVPRSAIIVRLLVDTTERALRRAVVIPVDSTGPCVVYLRLPSLLARHRAGDTQLLSACGFYAAFGPAGRGMTDWLTRTQLRTAGVHTAKALELSSDARNLKRMTPWRWTEWQALSCASGRLAACTVLLDGTQGQRVVWEPYNPDQILPPRRLTQSLRIAVFGGVGYRGNDDQTLAALRATIGDRRFAVLWQSARTPAATFAAIEGAPIEALLRSSLQPPGFTHRRGNGVGGWSLVVVLLATAGFAGLAIARSARRYVA